MATKSLIATVCNLFVASIISSALADEATDRTARAEQFLAKAQRICPVTGKELTSMGGPFKAEVDGQTVFLCCKGCVGREMTPQHWATVQKNLHMAHLALAQQICPVMGKDLLSMGGPIPAEIEGQTVFLCCKGCLKKQVKQEHWGQVQANLKAAQKLCPVRNVELGDEAVPVVVKGRVVYVCCDSGYCIREVEAHPDKYLAMVDTLLAKNLTQQASRPDARLQQ